jgi:uncharacterized phiE125 gp8 family phage protein
MTAPPIPAAALAAARESAKAYLRCAGSDDDAMIERLAAAGFALAEAFTGCALIARDWAATVPAGRGWQRLDMAPVMAIAGVTGLDAAGGAVPIDVSAYAIDLDARSEGWVRGRAPGVALLRVGYRAGLAEGWDDLPGGLAQGLVLLIAHGFDARTAALPPPAAVTALWRPWRRVRLGARAA